jgi:hypothetical protein
MTIKMEKEIEKIKLVEFLFKESCDNYNKCIKNREEDGSNYYEGKKNAYKNVLDIFEDDEEIISDIEYDISLLDKKKIKCKLN